MTGSRRASLPSRPADRCNRPIRRDNFDLEREPHQDSANPIRPQGRLNATRQGRLWTYVRDDRAGGSTDPPAVVFRYSPDRKGEHPRKHLKAFRGILQADGYAGFQELYGEQIQEAACWAHVRRKFYDVHVALKSPIAQEALERIGRLYAIEKDIRGQAVAERGAARQARAAPELDALHMWLHAQLARLSKKSELAKAIRYALSRWAALTRYRDDGRIEIDNNTAERALRTVALGRNYARRTIMRGRRFAAWRRVAYRRSRSAQRAGARTSQCAPAAHNHKWLRNSSTRSVGR